METSTVKWFNDHKGYGFIHHPDNSINDVFVHYTHISRGTLREGESVKFEIEKGPKGLFATDVESIN